MKRKTAYELRISDWSSDVCSSDPCAQAPHGRALAPALMFGARDDRGFGFVERHAVEEVAVHELAGAGIGFGPREMLCDLVAVGDHAVDGQLIFICEIEVALVVRSEEHTSELQSLMRISYAVFCLKKKKQNTNN